MARITNPRHRVLTRKSLKLLYYESLYICTNNKLMIMTTITINKRTKAGKTLLELAK